MALISDFVIGSFPPPRGSWPVALRVVRTICHVTGHCGGCGWKPRLVDGEAQPCLAYRCQPAGQVSPFDDANTGLVSRTKHGGHPDWATCMKRLRDGSARLLFSLRAHVISEPEAAAEQA
jgi:hypothetical protein